MVDLIMHNRFVDASARHGLASSSVFKVEMDEQERCLLLLTASKGRTLISASPGAYVKEGHAKVYLGRDIFGFECLLAKWFFHQDPWTWVLTGSRRVKVWIVEVEAVEADCLWLCAQSDIHQ